MKNPRWNFALSCLILATLNHGWWRGLWVALSILTILIASTEAIPETDPTEHDRVVESLRDDGPIFVKSKAAKAKKS